MSKNNYKALDKNLNRSFSFSGSKICVEESFINHKGERLVRHYSCEKIYDPSQNKVRQVKKSFFLKLNDSASENSPIKQNFLPLSPPNFSAETFNADKLLLMSKNKLFNRHNDIQKVVDESTPMEIDTSVEEQNISTSKTITENPSKISPKLPPNVGTTNKPTMQTMNQNEVGEILTKYLKLTGLFLIPIACAILLMHSDMFLSDDTNLDYFNPENITDALEDLLYGQQNVIDELKDAFKSIDKYKLIVFAGGIGVGKTYAASIISNNFQWKDNIIKIVNPQYKNPYDENRFIRSLSRNGYNLVIIDNLELQDVHSVIPFVNKMFKINKKIITLLIFTIPEYNLLVKESRESQFNLVSGSKQISSELNDVDLNHKLIVFNKLSEDIVRRCIHYIMAKKGLIINQYNIDNILHNINYEYSGCKSVYSKVQLLK